MRNKWFIISGPIAIATAILSGAGAVTASYEVAHTESTRVSEEQNLLRKIDSENAITNNVLNNNISVELGKTIDGLWYTHALFAKT